MFGLKTENVEELVKGFKLPPKPGVLTEIQKELRNPEPNIGHISDVISEDVALSAGILKLINSAFFGLNKTVTDIKQSAMLLGLESVTALVCLLEMQKAYSNSSISFERYWDESLEKARMGTFAIDILELKDHIPQDMIYSCGMFHDCGIVPMSLKFNDYRQVLMEANQYSGVFTDVERNQYNTDHAVIGYLVAKSWNFPDPVCQIILRHHDETLLQDQSISFQIKEVFCVLWAAINAVHLMRSNEPDPSWNKLVVPICQTLDIGEKDLTCAVNEMIDQFEVA